MYKLIQVRVSGVHPCIFSDKKVLICDCCVCEGVEGGREREGDPLLIFVNNHFGDHTCTINTHVYALATEVVRCRGSQNLQNLVAISQRCCRPLLTIKAGCIGSNGKNWLLNPESSSQSEG